MASRYNLGSTSSQKHLPPAGSKGAQESQVPRVLQSAWSQGCGCGPHMQRTWARPGSQLLLQHGHRSKVKQNSTSLNLPIPPAPSRQGKLVQPCFQHEKTWLAGCPCGRGWDGAVTLLHPVRRCLSCSEGQVSLTAISLLKLL